jgi:transcriptional antiterminator NusG
MPKQMVQRGRRWYAIHTYSGYEENVAHNLKQRIESMGMQDKIFNVLVPTEKKIKIKNGKRKIVTEKIFPGYVLVEMIVTDDSWYVVRNTPNVTGFIGAGTTPTPLSDEEMKTIQKRMGVQEPQYKIDVTVDTPVRIIDGPFKGFEGKISEIDEARGKVKVLVSMFGRETPIELDYLQVKKI